MSKSQPLVSVICLCYNQCKFVGDAINSVLAQTYKAIELIVIDDCSIDGSQEIISEIAEREPSIKVILNKENVGNCKAFNLGFAQSQGEYVIDLAADDLLAPDRIAMGINRFSQLERNYGIHYSPVELINEQNEPIGHFPSTLPEGDLYELLVQRFILSAPSMMIRREVLNKLKGYDESLTYEDFDFWIRSSRHFLYCASPEPLTKKRQTKTGLGSKQYRFRSKHMRSTYQVCLKAFHLNQKRSEDVALLKRISYEEKQALIYFHWGLLFRYGYLFFKTYFRSLSKK